MIVNDQYSNHHFLSPPRLSLLIFMPTKFCINKTLYKKESAKENSFFNNNCLSPSFYISTVSDLRRELLS
ncbi:hypothetical protein ENHY17A_110185 [Moraxellaceae bacterium 17A]|nr:hypothetical protein ENHY17A_110185 [Moraxellaceae bacterium 17A]